MLRKRQVLGLVCLLLISACDMVSDGSSGSFAEENFMGENMVGSGGNPAEQIWCEVLEQQAPRSDCELISKSAQVTDGSAALNVPDPMQRGDQTSVTLVVDRRTPMVIHELDDLNADNTLATGNELENVALTADDEGSNATTGDTPSPADTDAVANASVEQPQPAPMQNPTPKQQTDQMPGTTDTFDLKVGRQMRAELTGPGFEIIPESPAVQQIPKDDQGSWTWEVIARQGGPKTLTVRTVVEASVNGRTYQLRQTEHRKTVHVGISWWDRIKDWLRGLPEWLQLISATLTALAGVAGAWWLVKRNWRNGPGGGANPRGGHSNGNGNG